MGMEIGGADGNLCYQCIPVNVGSIRLNLKHVPALVKLWLSRSLPPKQTVAVESYARSRNLATSYRQDIMAESWKI